ncbi:hypothetical protein M422DRAFT_270389 [Sphaerobolus stellatus SS14]|uniref:Uncharacterized protein n=1 Tax=Sphaerobolus stellatus (strain SS14) TaxID=990650 RepID=A0A0C9TFZ2_SPHS4|nr:hypothetical protein M422DRAFT_270389 [Sphaerobolus stellatus SS14]
MSITELSSAIQSSARTEEVIRKIFRSKGYQRSSGIIPGFDIYKVSIDCTDFVQATMDGIRGLSDIDSRDDEELQTFDCRIIKIWFFAPFLEHYIPWKVEEFKKKSRELNLQKDGWYDEAKDIRTSFEEMPDASVVVSSFSRVSRGYSHSMVQSHSVHAASSSQTAKISSKANTQAIDDDDIVMISSGDDEQNKIGKGKGKGKDCEIIVISSSDSEKEK